MFTKSQPICDSFTYLSVNSMYIQSPLIIFQLLMYAILYFTEKKIAKPGQQINGMECSTNRRQSSRLNKNPSSADAIKKNVVCNVA